MNFYFEKTNGEIKGSGFKDYLYKCKDGFYEISIKRIYKNRSLQQNALYWAWNTQLEQQSDIGYTAEEWAEVFKEHFLKITVKCKSDKRKKIRRQRSTTDLTTTEFNEYLEKIRIFSWTHMQIRLKYPDDFSFTS